ncbi:MAG: hypothetical protein WB919_11650 [Candidatus Sulfotelmatobacter sp.]
MVEVLRWGTVDVAHFGSFVISCSAARNRAAVSPVLVASPSPRLMLTVRGYRSAKAVGQITR